MPSSPVPVDTFWIGINYFTFFIIYLPICILVYWVAEGRNENGQLWVVMSVFVPVVVPLVYFSWVLIDYFRSRKSGSIQTSAFEAPATEYSRQRLRGGSEFIGRKNDEIEILLNEGEIESADQKVRELLAEAERLKDLNGITDMIAYMERLKKLRKHKKRPGENPADNVGDIPDEN